MSGPDIREELTRKIVALLEKGETLPWEKPWEGVPVVPYNASTGKVYQGVNQMWLGFQGRSDPRWLTFRQVQALATQTKTPMHVRKGEKGTPIEKWLFDREETRVVPETGRTETVTVSRDRPVALTFTVFNAEQIEGLPPAPPVEPVFFGPSDVLTRHIVDLLDARVFPDGGDRAFYRRRDDTIHLPVRSAFKTEAGYNSTLLHELVHWTGHDRRLNTEFGAEGSEQRAFEELRAEIGSYYLNGTLGLSNDLQNHASYVESWLTLLKKDKHALPRALRLAGQAEDFVLDGVLEKERDPGVEKRLGPHLSSLGRSREPDRRDRTEETREELKVYEERAPAGRRFALQFPGVQDGGRLYVAESHLDLQGMTDRMGPYRETGNGTLVPQGWRALRGEGPETPVRIYVTEWRLEPETIREFFRTLGEPLSDRDLQNLGERLDWRDPVLAAGLPEGDGERPLFDSWQALARGVPVEIIRCVESADGKSREGLAGLSIRDTPQAGWVGLPPAEVVRRGQHDERGAGWLCPHPKGQAVIEAYRLDGFEAFRVTERGPGGWEETAEDRGAAPTWEDAQKIVQEICRRGKEEAAREVENNLRREGREREDPFPQGPVREGPDVAERTPGEREGPGREKTEPGASEKEPARDRERFRDDGRGR